MSAVQSRFPDPEFVDAVAQRVVELLQVRDSSGAGADVDGLNRRRPLTVAEVAALYGVSRRWVYAHQRELGAMRLGAGPRARLRFDSAVVAAAIAAFEADNERSQSGGKPRRRGREMPLIPFEPMG